MAVQQNDNEIGGLKSTNASTVDIEDGKLLNKDKTEIGLLTEILVVLRELKEIISDIK